MLAAFVRVSVTEPAEVLVILPVVPARLVNVWLKPFTSNMPLTVTVLDVLKLFTAPNITVPLLMVVEPV